MERKILVHALAAPPADFGRLGLSLLAAVEAEPDGPARLLVVGFSSDALLLGRHQRVASALEPAARVASGLPLARRAGGGRTLLVSPAQVGVLLAVPRPGALLDDPIGADRLLNRHVRGLLAALRGLGSPAAYFGRDFVSAKRPGEVASRQVAFVSQDGTASGACLVEALVALTAAPSLPAPLNGYPEHGDPRAGGPAWGTVLGAGAPVPALDELAARFGAALGETHGARVSPGSAPWLVATPEPALDEDETGFESSGVADVPVGFAEALVRHDGARVLEARLRGDFLAPAFALRALELELAGLPLAFDALGGKVDEVFRRPFAAVLGVPQLRVFADAVLAAAGRL